VLGVGELPVAVCAKGEAVVRLARRRVARREGMVSNTLSRVGTRE